MDQHVLLELLNQNYPQHFDRLEFLRDSGSVAYTAYSGEKKFFLRVTKPAMFDAASSTPLKVHLYLQQNHFPVPELLFTRDHSPCAPVTEEDGEHLVLLYEFLEGEEVDVRQDAEVLGTLVGRLHSLMRGFREPLPERDSTYYFERYLEQMRRKEYPRVEEFAAYGSTLWERVKDLPRGYNHGDLYSGNLLKTRDGKLFLLDLDTSCRGFPLYDPVLICHTADFFLLEDGGFENCLEVFARFLPEYLAEMPLSKREIDAFPDLSALYHFALQAVILDLFGLDCVDNKFLDQQLDWLYQWRKQSEEGLGAVLLETEDLALRAVTLGDLAEVARMWEYPHGAISLQKASEAVMEMRANHRKNRPGSIHHLCLAVCWKQSDAILGWCGLDGTREGRLDLFYAIDAAYRGRGFATQCAERLLSYAFEEARVPSVHGGCFRENTASYRVMEKAGMQPDGFDENGDPLFFLDVKGYSSLKKGVSP